MDAQRFLAHERQEHGLDRPTHLYNLQSLPVPGGVGPRP